MDNADLPPCSLKSQTSSFLPIKGELTDQKKIQFARHTSRDELLSVGAVCDRLESLPTSSVSAKQCPTETPLYVPAKAWKINYFHKSGFLKDSHDVYFQFSDNGMEMRGRGVDNIGVFFMKGAADVDIEV